MTLFPKIPLTVKRFEVATGSSKTGGHYERGKWVQGAEVGGNPTGDFIIKASVQPASGDEMVTFAEGRRIASMYKCFTDTEVFAADPVRGKDCDKITWNGQTFEVTHVEPWRNGIISHYMFIMIREKEIPAPQPPTV